LWRFSSLSFSFLFIIATTQPTTQNKTKEFGWSGIFIGKKTTPDHQPYSNPTIRNT
jgi:hypothetical protein